MGVLKSKMEITALTSGPKNHFFGDYGRSPWSHDGRRLLAHRTSLYDRPPGPDDYADIGYVDSDAPDDFIVLDQTTAWNWQRGSMPHWLMHDGRELVVYNTLTENRFAGAMIDVASGQKTLLPRSVYVINPKGHNALSLNYSRLHELRPGYGFAGIPDPFRDDPTPEEDGIFLINLADKSSKLLFSLKEIATFHPHPGTRNVHHWVNDLNFSPSGDRFCFLHRCRMPDGIVVTRLMVAETTGQNLRCVYAGMVSHFDWRSETEILAWAGERKLLDTMRSKGGLRRKLVGLAKPMWHKLGEPWWMKRWLLKDGYFIIHDGPEPPDKVTCPGLYGDGHCSYSQDLQWFMTDTYPDNKGRTRIFLCNEASRQTIQVAQVIGDARLRAGECRCDLHPRWDSTGQRICFDGHHEGGRQMYMLDVSEFVGG